jgi:hypothetical protein
MLSNVFYVMQLFDFGMHYPQLNSPFFFYVLIGKSPSYQVIDNQLLQSISL